jgi:hypothetical protein
MEHNNEVECMCDVRGWRVENSNLVYRNVQQFFIDGIMTTRFVGGRYNELTNETPSSCI